MNIGYACLTSGVPNTNFRRCIMKNATPEKLYELIEHNLASLKNILEYNFQNNINLFRITSDIIPFGSSPVNSLNWQKEFATNFNDIANFIKEHNMRVSMHPGQYTVLNSNKPDVVKRAIDDLVYHANFLDALKTNSSSKIILHIGGVYGQKAEAIKRFKSVYKTLDSSIKKRLVIENDDKSYNILDVIEIGLSLNIPVVYDNLHSEINPSDDYLHAYWIDKCNSTWAAKDGIQKIHYSQQAQDKPKGSHSKTINEREFIAFINSFPTRPIDIMLEVKDKNISAVKCINALNSRD